MSAAVQQFPSWTLVGQLYQFCLDFWKPAPFEPTGMGQTLSEPITTKQSATCADHQFRVASSCMQGWRINMEDAHTHLLSLPDDPQCAFFAVYDGHGGPKVSQYAGINLHKQILQQREYNDGNLAVALQKGFLALDEQMRNDADMKDDVSGTTAVVVLIKDKKIFCGNVGDSRAVACVKGEARALSYDHKPAHETEAKRIVAAGGWVEFNRVNGNLALSRALGDFVFKRNDTKPPEEQIVTAFPDIIEDEIGDDHEFVILACDGIWDVLSNEEVVDFVRERIAQGDDPQMICEELLTRCLAPDCQMGGLGCDNMTVVLVVFLHGGDYASAVERAKRPKVVTAAASSNKKDEEGTTEMETGLEGLSVDKETFVTPQPSPSLPQESEDERPPTEFSA